MYPLEEKKTLGMTVWSQFRIITSLVVAVDRTNTSGTKILKNNSELSYWTTEDVARIVQFIRTSNMQPLFEDFADMKKEKELSLLGKATKVWKAVQESPNRLFQGQMLENIRKRTDLNIQMQHFKLPNSKYIVPTRITIHPKECVKVTSRLVFTWL